MTADQLFRQIVLKRSFLCIGLDTDMEKIPASYRNTGYPLFEFNRDIIDITHKYAVAYKPNTAFYEYFGDTGWKQLELTVNYIRDNHPDIFVIADAKRGDIGNTARKYAGAFFEKMDCDAVTLSPYMGYDSVAPFISFKDKWGALLALTSNPGAADFQLGRASNNKLLFELVLEKSKSWGTTDNLMYVVGATRPEMLVNVRQIVPDHFLLIPGVGAQGGDLEAVAEYGLNDKCGLLVNVSRSVIFAEGAVHSDAVEGAAAMFRGKAEAILKNRGLI
jgi:orotidine-5'-phosphate decarboxylase